MDTDINNTLSETSSETSLNSVIVNNSNNTVENIIFIDNNIIMNDILSETNTDETNLDEIEQCPLCLENIISSDKTYICTKHMFHFKCMSLYILFNVHNNNLDINNYNNMVIKCPLCNRDLDYLIFDRIIHDDIKKQKRIKTIIFLKSIYFNMMLWLVIKIVLCIIVIGCNNLQYICSNIIKSNCYINEHEKKNSISLSNRFWIIYFMIYNIISAIYIFFCAYKSAYENIFIVNNRRPLPLYGFNALILVGIVGTILLHISYIVTNSIELIGKKNVYYDLYIYNRDIYNVIYALFIVSCIECSYLLIYFLFGKKINRIFPLLR